MDNNNNNFQQPQNNQNNPYLQQNQQQPIVQPMNNNYNPNYVNQPQQPKYQKPKSNKPIIALLIVIASLIEMVIVGFAVVGIYATATNSLSGRYNNPSYNQQQNPTYPNNNNNNNNGNGNIQAPQLPNNSSDSTNNNITNNSKARMGITCVFLDEDTAKKNNVESGLYVAEIDDKSDAKNRNIKIGDVITTVNGTKIESFQHFFDMIENSNPGDTLDLVICRPAINNLGEVSSTSTINEQITLISKDDVTTSSNPQNDNFPNS